MNQLKSNIGLIFLSLSIVIASIVLTKNESKNNKLTNDVPRGGIIKLSGDIAAYQIPVEIKTNSNDVTYQTEFKIDEGEGLLIQLSENKKETIRGENIVMRYFHVAKLLIVEYEFEGQKRIRCFNSPIAWGNGS